MTDLVVVSLERWDEVWRRNQHLVAGLLRRDPQLRVLFVEPAADPLYDLRERRRPRRGRGVRASPEPGLVGRLWTYQPTKPLPRRLDPRADRRIAHGVRRTAARLGFDRPVLWINDPAGAVLLRLTGWPALYDITDDWLEADRTPAEHARLVEHEAALMRGCGEIVVCSPRLERTKGAARAVTLVPNAVDVAAYRRPRPRPADLPPGPTAVYVGTVHRDRIDVDLCLTTARLLGAEGRLVLVGPAPLSAADRGALVSAGVVLLGSRPASEVPAYLQHADVLVVPHVVTPFTMSLDPIKRYEYAAVGRPVVSTPVTGFADAGDARVTIAVGDDFAYALRQEMRRARPFPAGADQPVDGWDERVTRMAGVIERVRRAATPR
ncbi:MAG TPA: glycosyltransferase [Propionibacteriaceae bacterium]|nr:glycosyltransferase [Propionibacteriaceae bacterium]